jgi:protein-S-isoprenylcysteine O-methyltransferase Ste14
MSDRPSATSLAERVSDFNDWFIHRIPGGMGKTSPRVPINLHKAMVGPLVIVLMLLTGERSLAAFLYLALHGSYGILWVIKDVAFPDPSWRTPCSISSAVAISVVPLGLYLMAPLIMLTRLGSVVPGGWGTPASLPVPVAFAAVLTYVLGAFLHFVSDAQKHFVLTHQRPRRLITNGLFTATRNPNYLGEILIYGSFCLLAQHWLPWAVCAYVWLAIFLPNMLRKDRSMSRYPEHAAWTARTGLLLPNPVTLARSLPLIFLEAKPGEHDEPR